MERVFHYSVLVLVQFPFQPAPQPLKLNQPPPVASTIAASLYVIPMKIKLAIVLASILSVVDQNQPIPQPLNLNQPIPQSLKLDQPIPQPLNLNQPIPQSLKLDQPIPQPQLSLQQ